MTRVILESWRDGLDKISLTKLQMELLGKSLKESKSNVDFLLDGKEIIIEISNFDLAKDFLREADKIGVNCKFYD